MRVCGSLITEPLLGVIPASREQALFGTKEQGASHKTNKGAGTRQILEQGAPQIVKRSMEQEKIPGAGGNIKKEQGAQENEKGAGKKV